MTQSQSNHFVADDDRQIEVDVPDKILTALCDRLNRRKIKRLVKLINDAALPAG